MRGADAAGQREPEHRTDFGASAVTVDDARSSGAMRQEAGSRGLACRIEWAGMPCRRDHGAVLEVLNFVSHASLAKGPLRPGPEWRLKGGMTARSRGRIGVGVLGNRQRFHTIAGERSGGVNGALRSRD